MSEDEESISLLFDRCEQTISEIDDCKCSPEKLKETIGTLEKLQQMISHLDLFSSNEEFNELSTTSLRYLLIPAYLGYSVENINDIDNRLKNLNLAKGYFRHFLERLLSYNVIAFKLDWIDSDGQIVPDAETPSLPERKNLAAERERKISRMKTEKELKNTLQKLEIEKRRNNDESTVREFVIVLLRLWALKTVNELQAIDNELPLLLHRQKIQSGEVKEEKPQPPPIKLPPFIIAKNEQQKKVFGLGYPSLPTYSVDEWYDSMAKSGKFGAMEKLNVQRIEETEENEIVEVPKDEDDSEETRQRKMAMDEWKDWHRRGEGNTYEDGELINDEEFKPDSRGPPPSGRSNANLWRDMILEQNLEEQMKTGPTIKGDKECTNRGTETYELPKFDEMDPEEVAKQQEIVNESLRRVVTAHDDLFNPTEDVETEYGINVKRFRKRQVPSDRVPIASADMERFKALNANFKRPRFNADNSADQSVRSYDPSSRDSSRSNSRQGSLRKRKKNKNSKKFGSQNSIASSNGSDETTTTTKSKNEDLPIPVSLLKDGFTPEKLQETVLDENLDPETFGVKMADALGETNPELVLFAVKTIGVKAANRIFNRTKGVEKNGGMHVDNQSRRRTPGGVFLKLLRSDKYIPDKLRDKVRDYGRNLYASKSANEKKAKSEAMEERIPTAVDIFLPKQEEGKMNS